VKNQQWTPYGRIEALLAGGDCVVLDGGVGSEIARNGTQPPDTWVIYDHPDQVLDVHRRYAGAGCDVISTHTWGILASTASARGRRPGRTGLPAWTVATRDAVTIARQAVAEAGRAGECAVAFCLNDADPLLPEEHVLLGLLWTINPPDLVLVETLTGLPSPPLCRAIASVAESGMPVWVSFRRAAAPPGERAGAFPAALTRLEQIGVQALLVNCIPVRQTPGALAELAAATTLPIGCYPRLDEEIVPAAYAELAAGWRAAGAHIVGGCCGVRPAHVGAVRQSLTRSGTGTR
jgi:S-methylmethionine-dependent homocysteine/selenocysteine methylase